ncbi:phosphoribosylanthranilate isomerase [Lysobacter auxotrophicus]|uniref:N-(5'-phosphoribosyl)anthranilate isomerase n=1 Tax=Lysobacter auxotrophicus TaxID=2992573 RepID=A0ABN6UIP7_9GAMM|nr:phosphoribosylanthranilate isomerase [Lysobacter auxotrophicus]BDU16149.1 phosphoribosylanthranilate isomerase [Lysobacter auxotrophicus]
MNAQTHTRIKFCGMTHADDIALACELGVDAIGLVFAERSSRRLTIEQARALRAGIAEGIEVVALFMDNDAATVQRVIDAVRPTVLQFHGREDEAFCAAFDMPYFKAVAMGGDVAADALSHHPRAVALLLDSHASGGAGGTGHAFDWSRIPRESARPFLLAGGLHPENIFDAVTAVHPWGVDVSSGIESAPGEKDAAKMRRFVEEVRRADSSER